MKTYLIKFTTQSIKNLRGVLPGLFTTLIFLNVLPKVWSQGLPPLFWTGNATSPATAGSGTWTTTATSGPFAWSSSSTSFTPLPSGQPWVDGSVAHFLGSMGGTVTLGTNITAAAINFDSKANTFTIATNGSTPIAPVNGNMLTVNGAIMNTSGNAQMITNNGGVATGTSFSGFITTPGSMVFSGTTITGDTTITNGGGTGSLPFGNAPGGSTTFNGTSSAGSAKIINSAGTGGGLGGLTQFSNTSTAGNATITNNGTSISSGPTAVGGSTEFHNTSTAGSATIINNGAFGDVPGKGGSTKFFDTSSAGSATITNNGGTGGGLGGLTEFSNTSTAGNVTIMTNGGAGVGSGGLTEFSNTSTAGNATIMTNGGAGVGSGGTTQFFGNSDGGTARAITLGNGRFDISGLTTSGMGIGSIAGDGSYILGSKMLTVGRNNLSTTVSGIIQGAGGSLTKIGTGTLTLTGANIYTGTTTVNDGSLIVDGSIASAQTLVNPGGLLGGIGSVHSLVNGGIVSPGDSPGTLTVLGNYTQNPNGTLLIEVAGLGKDQHDLLAVTGQANLAGTLRLIRLNNFKLQVGDKLTFLTAKSVSGTFGTIQNPFLSNTIVKSQILYFPDAVELVGTQGSFVSAACNPNTVAVAQSLDSAASDPRAAGLINFLNNQPLSKLCPDFTLIAPEQLASIYNIGVSLANVQTANLERRMDDIRAGSRGFSAAGFTLNRSTPNFSGGLSGPTGPEGKAGPSTLAPIPENRWGVFATGVGEFTDIDSTGIARGYDLQTGGITLGVDYRVCPNFAIGLLAGYAHTNADLANNGDLDVNSGTFGVYATAFTGGFYLDTALIGGISGYDSHRTALLGTASGSTDGGELNVLVNGGYDWKKGDLTVGPTASFQYTYVSFGGFTESGSLAPLTFPDQHVDSIRTAFGAKASYDWKVGHALVRPELRLAWQHEYGDSAYSIVASFANGAGSGFTVSSPRIGRDSLLIGAGAAVLLNDRISIYTYYDGELARTNYESNNVSAGVRITF